MFDCCIIIQVVYTYFGFGCCPPPRGRTPASRPNTAVSYRSTMGGWFFRGAVNPTSCACCTRRRSVGLKPARRRTSVVSCHVASYRPKPSIRCACLIDICLLCCSPFKRALSCILARGPHLLRSRSVFCPSTTSVGLRRVFCCRVRMYVPCPLWPTSLFSSRCFFAGKGLHKKFPLVGLVAVAVRC